VVHSEEDGDGAGQGQHRRGIRAPDLIGHVRGDAAVVGLVSACSTGVVGRRQAVGPHQAPDALLGGPDALVSEARPDLAVALTMEGRRLNDPADAVHQLFVEARPGRASPTSWRTHRLLPGQRSIDCGPGNSPDLAGTSHGVPATASVVG